MTDLTKIDPGVRRLVALLNAHEFKTTDSGDGISKPDDARWVEYPHVVIRVQPNRMLDESFRLVDVLKAAGVVFDDESERHIEARWSPLDGVALILVTHVSDADLKEGDQ